ncbi:MAG: hypothetical protein WCG23_08645 [bacterium]
MSFLDHPLNDSICKINKDIIYVSPVTSGNFLDIEKLQKYQTFIIEMDNKTFLNHFNETKTREHLKLFDKSQ